MTAKDRIQRQKDQAEFETQKLQCLNRCEMWKVL